MDGKTVTETLNTANQAAEPDRDPSTTTDWYINPVTGRVTEADHHSQDKADSIALGDGSTIEFDDQDRMDW